MDHAPLPLHRSDELLRLPAGLPFRSIRLPVRSAVPVVLQRRSRPGLPAFLESPLSLRCGRRPRQGHMLLADRCARSGGPLPVADGDRGYQFRQVHRVPGAHLVARRQIRAGPDGQRDGVGLAPTTGVGVRGCWFPSRTGRIGLRDCSACSLSRRGRRSLRVR